MLTLSNGKVFLKLELKTATSNYDTQKVIIKYKIMLIV